MPAETTPPETPKNVEPVKSTEVIYRCSGCGNEGPTSICERCGRQGAAVSSITNDVRVHLQ